MTPAAQLEHAVYLAEQAISRMHTEAGITKSAALEVISSIDDLRAAVDELPDKIAEQEMTHCADCHLYRMDRMLEAYGEGTATHFFHECMAKRATDCPAVNACGFGADELPAFLKREAE